MQELDPDERTDKRFLENLRHAIHTSSIRIGERIDEEVARMMLTEEFKGHEEKYVYMVYLDEGSARARRLNEQDEQAEFLSSGSDST